MKLRLWSLLGTFLAGAGLTLAPSSTHAQQLATNPILPDSNSSPAASWSESVMAYSSGRPSATGSRGYASGEYLFWWVKGAPIPVPLVSTGPKANEEGFLFNSASLILYGGPHPTATGGDATQDFAPFSGTRLTVGAWLDDDQRFALEGSGFLLERGTASFVARGDDNGFPGMRIPVFNTVPYSPGSDLDLTMSENGLPVSLPGILGGGVSITHSLRLWGAEATGVVNLYRDSSWAVDGLAGFRYLDLFESLNLQDDLVGLSGPFVGQSGVVRDHFQTRNQFYGGSLGMRGRYLAGPLSVALTGRVALGCSHEVLNIGGEFQAVNFTSVAGPQGIFAQPSNSGRRAADDFAVIPEVQLKLSYAITSWLGASVGYDFLYYSSVLRPGDQMDRNLPKGQIFQQGGTAVSTTSPAPLFNTTDFFAHGLSFGLEFRY